MEEANETTSEEFRQLTDRQRRAIPYIVAAPDIRKGCREAGISDTVFHNWMKIPAFKAAVEQERNTLISESLTKLRQGIGKAIDKLLLLVDSEQEEVSRKASTSIIEMTLKLRENEEIEERLESIERIVLERRSYR